MKKKNFCLLWLVFTWRTCGWLVSAFKYLLAASSHSESCQGSKFWIWKHLRIPSVTSDKLLSSPSSMINSLYWSFIFAMCISSEVAHSFNLPMLHPLLGRRSPQTDDITQTAMLSNSTSAGGMEGQFGNFTFEVIQPPPGYEQWVSPVVCVSRIYVSLTPALPHYNLQSHREITSLMDVSQSLCSVCQAQCRMVHKDGQML